MKYKLIKAYPKSEIPKGTIVEFEQERNGYWNKAYQIGFNKRHVLDFPEFWEKVEEKDYEILSFADKRNSECIFYVKNGICKWSEDRDDFTIDELLNNELMFINSIKRLSDNEVFTIGDIVTAAYSKHKETKTISKIEFYNSNYKCNVKISLTDGYNGVSPMCDIEHAKTPLFTTEDGVDIFEGDKLIFGANVAISAPSTYNKKAKSTSFNGINWKYFSTREIRDDYILKNRKIYSEKDMVEFAKYAKNYCTPKVVGDAFNKWKENE